MLRRLTVAAAALAGVFTASPAFAWQVTWLGHAGFLVEAKDGTRVLIDPWLQNPKYPQGYELPARVDAVLVTHGHFDHAGSATELSRRFHAPIVGCYELTNQLQPKEGPAGMGGNVGGTMAIKGIRVSLVPAVHSSSMGGDEKTPPTYTGAPVGFVLQAAGEKPLFHAGDTGLTRDFETVREVFKPGLALLPIGGHFTMDPAQAAIATRYLGVTDVVPMHYGTFPVLAGTPAQLEAAIGRKGARVHALQPGKTTAL